MSLAMKILTVEIPYAVQIDTGHGVKIHILETASLLDQEIREKLRLTKMRLTFEDKIRDFKETKKI